MVRARFFSIGSSLSKDMYEGGLHPLSVRILLFPFFQMCGRRVKGEMSIGGCRAINKTRCCDMGREKSGGTMVGAARESII